MNNSVEFKKLIAFSHSINTLNPEIKSLDFSNLYNGKNGLDGLDGLDDFDNDLGNIPSIVMIGSQSSGKSTLINRIAGFNVSPTGSGLVTTAPLNILMKTSENRRVVIENKYFDNFKQTAEEVEMVQQYIRTISKQFADEQHSPISSKSINIVIESPNVCNISMIDLPGLIAVPKQQNQMELIDKINNIAAQFISRPNCIVAVMIQAGSDLETNIALALLKKYNYQLSNCVGVLTKVDLTDISDDGIYEILNGGTVPDAFRMEYGYFAIQCKTLDKINNNNRFGVDNLLQFLAQILMKSLKVHHNKFIKIIDSIHTKLQGRLINLGDDIIFDEANGAKIDQKIFIVHKHLVQLCGIIVSDIENYQLNNINNNLGSCFKSHALKLKTNIKTLNPFTIEIYTNEYFDKIIATINGYHMDNYVSSVKLLEFCLLDKEKNPMKPLHDLSVNYIIAFSSDLTNKIKQICTETNGYNLYPQFYNAIYQLIIQYIQNLQKNALKAVNEFTEFNNSYIWTGDNIIDSIDSEITTPGGINSDACDYHDPYTEYTPIDKNYKKSITEKDNKNKFKYNILRRQLETYYNTVKDIYIKMVPKICMTRLIRELQINLYKHLTDKLTQDIINNITENESIIAEKKKLRSIIGKIIEIKENSIINV